MKDFVEFKFNSVYSIADLTDDSIKGGAEFWNYNQALYISSATKFSKFTLLHLYIITNCFNHYRRDFRKWGGFIDEEEIEYWYDLFNSYEISYEEFEFEENAEIFEWFEKHETNFLELFEKMAEEVFYILFANRGLLLEFNKLLHNTTIDVKIDAKCLTKKGTIKRVNIPSWVKKAVFHRDKGRCVFCNKDLTNIFNTLNNTNYDHMVPLDLMGVNDPTNLQLTCETCNKSKSNREESTGLNYIPWW